MALQVAQLQQGFIQIWNCHGVSLTEGFLVTGKKLLATSLQ